MNKTHKLICNFCGKTKTVKRYSKKYKQCYCYCMPCENFMDTIGGKKFVDDFIKGINFKSLVK